MPSLPKMVPDHRWIHSTQIWLTARLLTAFLTRRTRSLTKEHDGIIFIEFRVLVVSSPCGSGSTRRMDSAPCRERERRNFSATLQPLPNSKEPTVATANSNRRGKGETNVSSTGRNATSAAAAVFARDRNQKGPVGRGRLELP